MEFFKCTVNIYSLPFISYMWLSVCCLGISGEKIASKILLHKYARTYCNVGGKGIES